MTNQSYEVVQKQLMDLCLERIEAADHNLDTKDLDEKIEGLEWLLNKIHEQKAGA